MSALESYNVIRLRSGRVRLVCTYCDRRSSPRDSGGLGELPRGWWMAPYPAGHVHPFDGSTGAMYTCQSCDHDLIGRAPMRGRGLEAPLPTLVERQLDGWACIECGAEPSAMRPALHSGPRGQLFVCANGEGCSR